LRETYKGLVEPKRVNQDGRPDLILGGEAEEEIRHE
jgi:hypothetical protein